MKKLFFNSTIKVLLVTVFGLLTVASYAQCSYNPSTASTSGCSGSSYTLSATSFSTSVTTHKWYTTPSGSTTVTVTVSNPGSGIVQSSLTSNFSASVTYYVAAVCTGGTESTRIPVSFTLTTPSTISYTTSSDPTAVSISNHVTLTASGGSAYEWRYNLQTSSPVSAGSTFTPTRGGTYNLRGTNNCGTVQNLFQAINYKPIVDAGPDHSIGLPASFTMYGSGSDPDGHAITYAWTKQSGPAVTMGATNGSSLLLTNILAGTYVFRLTVTDIPNNKTSFDEVTVVAASYTNNLNYVQSETVKVPGKLTNGDLAGLGVADKSKQTVYTDGVGKTIQSIQYQGSPGAKDQLVINEYDELGRQKKSYLPMTTLQNSGSYVSTALTDQYNFYNDIGFSDPNEFIIDDIRPFSEQTFETSPLGRVLTSKGPGSAWASISSSVVYGTNAASEVRIYTVGATGLPTNAGTYPTNVLSVTVTTDEQAIESRSYSTREGLKILEKRKVDATNWAETYYVYDNYNNLRFIVPPELVKIASPTQTHYDTWAYQFIYDNLKRQIETKGPGTDWVYNVYDGRDRLVLSQDGKQRQANEWSYTKYDGLDRPHESGIYRPGIAISRADLQIAVDASNAVNPSAINIVLPAYVGTNTYVASNSITLQPGFTFNAATSGSFKASISDPYGENYAASYPQQNVEKMVVSYYDSYVDCSVCQDPNFAFVNESWGTDTSNEPFAKTDRVRGQTIAGSVKVLGTADQWLHSVTYFNRQQQAIQTISSNHLGGRVRASSSVEFSGRTKATLQTYLGFNVPVSMIKRRFTYDHADRLMTVKHQLNTQPEVTLISNLYNELGELVDKSIHSVAGSPFLQSVDYRYAIRGWMTRMNSTAGTDAGDPTDYFALELAYNNTFGALNSGRNDGFITGAKWKNSLSSKEAGYGFSYNNLGWLTAATFKQNESNNWASQNSFFSEDGLTYDYNGNIQTLNRRQQTAPTISAQIDQLAYNYGTTGGNRLFKVTDNTTAAAIDKAKGFNDLNTTGDDYTYDVNGNLTQDKNKGINTINYNYLNLTDRVTFNDNSYIQYTYDAAGAKLRQAYYNATGQVQSKTDYVDEFILLNDQLKLIMHEEGRIVGPDYNNLVANPTREANGTEGFTATNVTVTSEFIGGQTYIKGVCSVASANPGFYPIGGATGTGIYTVKENESYLLQVLGYQSVGTTAKLYVWSNTGDLIWTSAPTLPIGSANENWTSATFTIPTGVTQIKIGVRLGTPAVGDTYFINRIALYKTDWEYQYFLSDQVGSPRVVLGTTPNVITFTATMETENHSTENTQFLNLNSTRFSVNALANQTQGGNEAITLNNAYRIGPAKSFKVFPGDNIDASAYSYWTTSSGLTQTPFATMSSALISVMAGGVTPMIDGINAAYTNTTGGLPGFLLEPFQGSTRPSAFINYILFDETYKPIEAKSTPVGSSAGVKQLIALPTISVKETGYLFVYLSYDNESTQLVYFDDLAIKVTESPVVQVNNYYPYGLVAMEWVREGETDNNFLFQGKELIDQTGWHDFGARMYAGDLGRWFATDPAGQFASPFNAMGNNPVMGVDPDGRFVLAAIALGAIMNTTIQALSGKIDNMGDFLKAAGVGALSGLAGAGAAAAVAGATSVATTLGGSILNGASIGAASGAAGGFIGGAGNAWASGASFSGGLKSGLQAGGIGAISGGLIGGVSGGIKYKKDIGVFLRGAKNMGIDPNQPVPETDLFLNQAQQNWYPDAPMNKVSNFTVENVPEDIIIRMGDAGDMARTLPIYGNDGLSTGFSNVYFNSGGYPYSPFQNAKTLFFTMGHEFVHVSQYAALAGSTSKLLENVRLKEIMEYHAWNYNSQSNESPSKYLKISKKYFDLLNWNNFSWTKTANFLYPFK